MAGCIIQVWFAQDTDVDQSQHKQRFYIIETELEDFATACELVDADRLIGGAILTTNRIGHLLCEIVSRRPIAFRGSAVSRIELPRFSYQDAS